MSVIFQGFLFWRKKSICSRRRNLASMVECQSLKNTKSTFKNSIIDSQRSAFSVVDCSVCGWLFGYCPYQVATEKNSPFIRRLPMIRTIAQCFPKPKTTKFILPALGDGVTFPLIATLKNDATGWWEFWNASPATPGPFQKPPSHPQHFMVFLQPPPDRQTQTDCLLFPRGVS